VGAIFGFVYPAVRGYNEFYNQYKEIWEASFITSIRRYGRLVTETKRKNFDPFAVSVMN